MTDEIAGLENEDQISCMHNLCAFSSSAIWFVIFSGFAFSSPAI